MRGPIGGWLVWDGTFPAIEMAGGAGVVPLIAMLRHAEALRCGDLLHTGSVELDAGQIASILQRHDGR